MNEADSVFATEGSLVEIPYIEPSFFGILDVMSMIQSLMAYERIIGKMLCGMCKTLYIVCNMIRMMILVTLMA